MGIQHRDAAESWVYECARLIEHQSPSTFQVQLSTGANRTLAVAHVAPAFPRFTGRALVFGLTGVVDIVDALAKLSRLLCADLQAVGRRTI